MTVLADLVTPALVVERAEVTHNLDTMSAALPGGRLRPHVKAHKCTALAREQASRGHTTFTCATVREVEGMAAAGLGDDLLLANEVLEPGARRLAAVQESGARVTLAIDSEETARAAAAAGVREVLVDVDVGLPRCGVKPEGAGALADLARSLGLEVRGVMGYEGHVVGLADRAERSEKVAAAMADLLRAAADVGGDIVSAGGTGTWDLNTWAGEIQAGSYALMDTAYASLNLPFKNALTILATVISLGEKHAVVDAGLKAMGMDHGNPEVPGARVWFVADEHTVFTKPEGVRVGDQVRIVPAHVDPTVAYHERMWVVDGDEVVDEWPVDLRGW